MVAVSRLGLSSESLAELEPTLNRAIAMLVAYVVGQGGIADAGKERARLEITALGRSSTDLQDNPFV